MDSLLLSDELFWDGKMELLSPLNTNVFLINGTTTIISNTNDFLEDNFLNESWDSKTGSPPPLLHNFFVSENDFILPFPSTVNREYPMDIKITDTTDLHKNILTQLTPPQSPPRASPSAKGPQQSLNFNDAASSCNIQAVSPTCSSLSNVSKESEHFADNIWNGNNSSESLSSFSQMVDEIVSTRAKELNDYSDPISLILPPVLSLFDNTYSVSNSVSTTSSTSCSPIHVIENCTDASSMIPTNKCARVYERRTEDRKVRKKEQNKNAATRYRLKKKQEMQYVLSEEQILTNRNLELKEKLADRKREAKYLKALICEFYKNKK